MGWRKYIGFGLFCGEYDGHLPHLSAADAEKCEAPHWDGNQFHSDGNQRGLTKGVAYIHTVEKGWLSEARYEELNKASSIEDPTLEIAVPQDETQAQDGGGS